MDRLQPRPSVEYAGLKVLVTGADGFIGSHLTEMLAGRGASVTALSLYNSFDSHGWIDDLPVAVRDKLSLMRGDIRDPTFTRRIVRGQDIVFHLAALIAIPHSYVAAHSYVETNILGTLNVLEAAAEFNVQRVVQTSTSEVYGSAITMPITEAHPLQGQSPYSATKIGADMLAESYFRSFELPVVILRPFNTFGPRQSERAVIPVILRQILDPESPTIMIGDTSPIRDFTYVTDTAAAFLAAGAAPDIEYGRPYNAGSGKAVTVLDVINLVREITHCEKPLETDPNRARPVKSEVRALLADSSRLTADTGWQPTVGLREGIERTIDWWDARLAGGKVRRERAFVA